MVAVLKWLNIGDGPIVKIASSGASTFVLSYAVHKCFAPLRIAVTLTATPFIVRYLRNIGFLKNKLNNSGIGK